MDSTNERYVKYIKPLKNFFEEKKKFSDNYGDFFLNAVKYNDVETVKFLLEKIQASEYYVVQNNFHLADILAKTEELKKLVYSGHMIMFCQPGKGCSKALNV